MVKQGSQNLPTLGEFARAQPFIKPPQVINAKVTSIQEGNGHNGSGRRKDEYKDINEPVTEEYKTSHDAKTARSTWRR